MLNILHHILYFSEGELSCPVCLTWRAPRLALVS